MHCSALLTATKQQACRLQHAARAAAGAAGTASTIGRATEGDFTDEGYLSSEELTSEDLDATADETDSPGGWDTAVGGVDTAQEPWCLKYHAITCS